MTETTTTTLGAIEAVSFDFTGTLAHAPRVGEIYAEVFERHGISAAPETLGTLFREAWLELDCRVELGHDRFREHPEGARGFWRTLLERVAERLGEDPPTPFLVAELFDRFRQPDAWEVWPDVVPGLEALRAEGRRLAVLSNFDHRLPEILEALALGRFFETVLTSWEARAEKPHPLPFEMLQARLEVHPRRLAHVGDDRRRDVEGAEAVGMRGVWLVRDEASENPGDLSSLTELPAVLRRLESSW